MAAQTSIFDHVAITVPAAIFESEIQFLTSALAPLGMVEHTPRMFPLLAAVGPPNERPAFWVSGMEKGKPLEGDVTRTHIAFKARDKDQVAAFHQAALKAGGADYGAPGYRPQFGEGYYAAFIISPAGHNVEAILRE